MKTIIVDDNSFNLTQLLYEISEFSQVEPVGTFSSVMGALRFASHNNADLVFLKLSMPEINWIELAREFRRINSKIIIVLVSDTERKPSPAIRSEADLLLSCPFTHAKVEAALFCALALLSRQRRRVFIRTFGSFGVFVDGAPLHFSSSKAQELLAYLVDRNGNVVGSREGFSVLWEDKLFSASSSSSYRKVLSRLSATLEEAGISNILRVYPRGRAINKSAVDCDYYSYLSGDKQTIVLWNGEYMTNYSWGEQTLGWLNENHRNYPHFF